MFLKIGDLKLLNIKIIQNGNIVYEGKVENAPDELKEVNYKSANFESKEMIVEI